MKIRYYKEPKISRSKLEVLELGYHTRPIRSEPTPWAQRTCYHSAPKQPSWTPKTGIGPETFPKLPYPNGITHALEWGGTSKEVQLAYNKAYASFVRKMGGSEEVGTALAEISSSLRMAHNRAHQLSNAWDALRHGTLGEMFTVLGMDRDLLKRKHRQAWNRRTKSLENASGLWLEYWMGWSPLMGDIYAAPRALASYQSKYYIRTGGTQEYKASATRGNPPWGAYSVRSTCDAVIQCHMSGEVRVTNPNYHLLKNLGMSPQDIVWNILPWSWMIDWFGNIGQVLSSMNDWVGVEVRNLSVTTSYKGTCHEKFYYFGSGPNASGDRYRIQNKVTRGLPKGVPQPRPVVHLPDFSLTRLATTLSLIGTRIFR